MHKIAKIKIKSRQAQLSTNNTPQIYPPKVGNLIPVKPAPHFKCQTRYTNKTTLKTRVSGATYTNTSPGSRSKRMPHTGPSVSHRQMLNSASKV